MLTVPGGEMTTKVMPIEKIMSRREMSVDGEQLECKCGNNKLSLEKQTFRDGTKLGNIYCLECETLVGYRVPYGLIEWG